MKLSIAKKFGLAVIVITGLVIACSLYINICMWLLHNSVRNITNKAVPLVIAAEEMDKYKTAGRAELKNYLMENNPDKLPAIESKVYTFLSEHDRYEIEIGKVMDDLCHSHEEGQMRQIWDDGMATIMPEFDRKVVQVMAAHKEYLELRDLRVVRMEGYDEHGIKLFKLLTGMHNNNQDDKVVMSAVMDLKASHFYMRHANEEYITKGRIVTLAERQRFKKNFVEHSEEFSKRLDILQTAVGGTENQALTNEILQIFGQFVSSASGEGQLFDLYEKELAAHAKRLEYMASIDVLSQLDSEMAEKLVELAKEHLRDVESETEQMVKSTSVIFTLISVIAISGCWVFSKVVSKRIVRPILALSDAAAIIAKGDLSKRVEVAVGDDEIGQLCDAFNKMTEDLSRSIDSLNAANQQLLASEQQLKADEQQLKSANQQLTASEQQLKAANQQLKANEQQLKSANQQLKAANQQLKADEQQLRATHQQLAADEQQLRAANQQLKSVNQKLQESEERLRGVLRHSPSVIFLKDLQGRYLLVNRRYEELFHVTNDEVQGKTDYDLFPKETANRFRDNDRMVLSSGTAMMIDEEVPQDDGVHSYLSLRFPVRNDGGKITSVCGIATDITERKQAEKKLLEYQKQLKSLASELSLAEERQRRRIATELHDRISQSLVISKVELQSLRQSVDSVKIAKSLDRICDSLGQIIQDTRTLTFDFGSPILYELGFETAVAEWLIEQVQEKHGIATVFEDDNKPKVFDDDIRALLFRDVRELLINVVKHAKAKKVKVSIKKINKFAQITVEDDGVGFDASKLTLMPDREGGFGIFSIRERLEHLGGKITIDSKPGHGSKIMLTAPLKQ